MAWERIQRWGRVVWERIRQRGRVIFYQQSIRASKARGYGVEMHHLHIFYRQLFILWLMSHGGSLFLSSGTAVSWTARILHQDIS